MKVYTDEVPLDEAEAFQADIDLSNDFDWQQGAEYTVRLTFRPLVTNNPKYWEKPIEFPEIKVVWGKGEANQANGEKLLMTKEQAIAISEKDAGGFLGTWVSAIKYKNQWLVHAFSKSANPPVLYVIEESSGRILYKSLNSDEPVNITGRAMDTGAGAVLVTDNGMEICLEKPASWPAKYSGKQVTVKGTLRCKQYNGKEQLVMENAEWGQAK
jgi:hypothetical protein